MAHIRVFFLILALLGFYVLGVPLQRLARRHGWLLARSIPPFFARTTCALLGLRVRFEGEEPGPKPRMIVANHVSWSDILALASRETPCFVAKSEVARWPLLGAFARVQDTIFVRRDCRADVPRVNAAMAEKMMAGEDVLLFGEGTSSDGEGVLSFKPAHFAAASGLPTIVLFGPETPNLYRPLGNSIPIYAGLACSPCVSASNHRKSACDYNVCMRAISVEQVFAAVTDVLAAPTRAS